MKRIILFNERPIQFSLLIMIFALITFYLPTKDLYSKILDPQYAYLLGEISNKIIVSIVLLFIFKKISFIENIGLTAFPRSIKDWMIIWPIFIILFIGLIPLITKDVVVDQSKPLILIIFTFMALLTGFSEEILFRGLLLSVMLLKWGNTKKGIVFSVLASSVLFGIAHIGNFFINPDLVVATFSQIIYSTLIGIFFAACVLRSQTIWPVIFSHSAINFVAEIKEVALGGGIAAATEASASMSLMQAFQPMIIYMVLASYAFFLLKKVTPALIKSRFQNLR